MVDFFYGKVHFILYFRYRQKKGTEKSIASFKDNKIKKNESLEWERSYCALFRKYVV